MEISVGQIKKYYVEIIIHFWSFLMRVYGNNLTFHDGDECLSLGFLKGRLKAEGSTILFYKDGWVPGTQNVESREGWGADRRVCYSAGPGLIPHTGGAIFQEAIWVMEPQNIASGRRKGRAHLPAPLCIARIPTTTTHKLRDCQRGCWEVSQAPAPKETPQGRRHRCEEGAVGMNLPETSWSAENCREWVATAPGQRRSRQSAMLPNGCLIQISVSFRLCSAHRVCWGINSSWPWLSDSLYDSVTIRTDFLCLRITFCWFHLYFQTHG